MPTITKALGQISIIDLTDGYTVSLDQDAGSFTADSNYTAINNSTQFSINITALQGSESISGGVKIGACIIKNASGQTISNGSITALAASGNISPVTVTVYGGTSQSAFTGEMATVTIPVYVEGDPANPSPSTDIIINKIFTLSAAAQGESGQPGTSSYTYIRYAEDDNGTGISTDPDDSRPYMAVLITNSSTPPSTSDFAGLWTKYLGENGQDGTDGVSFYIESSNGTYFKNTGVSTRLTVHMYKADGTEETLPSNLEWYKGDPNNGGTKVTNTSHRSYIDIGAGDVTNTETYFVVLEETV